MFGMMVYNSSNCNHPIMMCLVIMIFVLCFVVELPVVDGFVFHRYYNHQCQDLYLNHYYNNHHDNVLFASKKKNKNKKKRQTTTTTTRTTGFGGAGSETSNKNTDKNNNMIPPLEQHVQETLVPVTGDSSTYSSSNGSNGKELSVEMYDRLEQIYGFSNFNYHKTDKTNHNNNDPNQNQVQQQDTDLSNLLLLSNHDDDQQSSSSSSSSELPLWKMPSFSSLEILHIDPLVISIPSFFTHEECDRYIQLVLNAQEQEQQEQEQEQQQQQQQQKQQQRRPFQTQSKTVGNDSYSKAQRTSTTWFHYYSMVPEFMAKASRLLGLTNIHRWEEPQIVRYRKNEKFTWHLDALDPSDSKTKQLGGQRVATLLVYLTELQNQQDGGATIFRDLRSKKSTSLLSESEPGSDFQPLRVQPQKGAALLFFPSAGGIPNAPLDIRTLHCGEMVSKTSTNDKWIAQLWLRQNTYQPTAPPGNKHSLAIPTIVDYCNSYP